VVAAHAMSEFEQPFGGVDGDDLPLVLSVSSTGLLSEGGHFGQEDEYFDAATTVDEGITAAPGGGGGSGGRGGGGGATFETSASASGPVVSSVGANDSDSKEPLPPLPPPRQVTTAAAVDVAVPVGISTAGSTGGQSSSSASSTTPSAIAAATAATAAATATTPYASPRGQPPPLSKRSSRDDISTSQPRQAAALLQAPRYAVGQAVEIRMGGRGQWSSARVIARRGGCRLLVELSTKQQLEVLEENVRPLLHILQGAAADTSGSIKSGYLSKAPLSALGTGSSGGGFASRFFVLNAAHLAYYRDETAKYPKGKIVFKHGDVVKKVDDTRFSIQLVDGYALKSNNLILTAMSIQSEDQRVPGGSDQTSDGRGHRMVRTNSRHIMLKAESRDVARAWLDAISTTLDNLQFAATLTSDELVRYRWHPWISRDGNVVVQHADYDPEEHLNDASWCMPLPIAVTSLLNLEATSSSSKLGGLLSGGGGGGGGLGGGGGGGGSGGGGGPGGDSRGLLWNSGMLEGIAAWVVGLTPDNVVWRRQKNRPALATVKPELVKLLGRALVLLVRVGDADTAAVLAEKAVLMAYAHVALATLSFSLSILSDAIQRMHCPPMDMLQSRKFSDPEECARRAIDYAKVEPLAKGKAPAVELIPPELHYFCMCVLE
jgi:hypothetical protein